LAGIAAARGAVRLGRTAWKNRYKLAGLAASGIGGRMYRGIKRKASSGGYGGNKRRKVMRRGVKKMYQRARRVRFSRGNTMSQPQVSEEIRQRINIRRVSNRAVVTRAVSAGVTPYTLFWKNLSNEFDRSRGTLDLGRQRASPVDSWPVYCFNLTTIVQGTNQPAPMYRLLSDNLTGRYYWSAQDGILSSGSFSPFLNVRNSVNVTSSGILSPKAVLDWARIRMILYCPATRPVKYRVRIVQFYDDEVVPEFQTANGTPLNPNVDLSVWAANYLKPIVGNPISSSGMKSQRIKILHSRTFTLEPGQTDDKDTNPGRRIVDWFLKLGRVVNFYNRRSITTTNPVSGQESVVTTGTNNLVNTPVVARQRVYCLIDAGAYERFGKPAAPNEFDANIHGSFDCNFELGYKVTDSA